tara:strand:+ start:8506 stop:8895 length:390 start_codon:yes stop_codon:yes gene_type:complete
MYNITLKHKDVIKGINWKFNNYINQYKEPFADREGIYIRAFRHYLVLSEYGVFPEKASVSLSALTKLHLGYDVDEIHELILRLSTNNIKNITGGQSIPLTEKENTAVLEYHKVLFGKFCKKDNPYDLFD